MQQGRMLDGRDWGKKKEGGKIESYNVYFPPLASLFRRLRSGNMYFESYFSLFSSTDGSRGREHRIYCRLMFKHSFERCNTWLRIEYAWEMVFEIWVTCEAQRDRHLLQTYQHSGIWRHFFWNFKSVNISQILPPWWYHLMPHSIGRVVLSTA